MQSRNGGIKGQEWRPEQKDLKVEGSRPFAILSYEVVQVSETLEIQSIKFRPYVIVVPFTLGPARSEQAC